MGRMLLVIVGKLLLLLLVVVITTSHGRYGRYLQRGGVKVRYSGEVRRVHHGERNGGGLKRSKLAPWSPDAAL